MIYICMKSIPVPLFTYYTFFWPTYLVYICCAHSVQCYAQCPMCTYIFVLILKCHSEVRALCPEFFGAKFQQNALIPCHLCLLNSAVVWLEVHFVYASHSNLLLQLFLLVLLPTHNVVKFEFKFLFAPMISQDIYELPNVQTNF